VPMTFVAVASVCDMDVPATPVTPEILGLARASAGVTVRDNGVVREKPSAAGVMLYVEVTVSVGAVPAKEV